MERMIAEMRTNIGPSLTLSAERQAAVLDELGDHLNWQKSKLTEVLENLSVELRNLAGSQPRPHPEQKALGPGYVRLDRVAVGGDAGLRFGLLKDWVRVNSLAIVRRASRPYTSASELIAAIPEYLQAEAEVLESQILLIGTRNHSEKLAIPIQDIEATCRYRQWFDLANEGPFAPEVPAVLARNNGTFDLNQKGMSHRVSD
jgi:hypothetical protein